MSSKKLTDFFSKTTSSSPPEKQQEQKQEQENNEIVIAEKYHPPQNIAFPKSVVGKQLDLVNITVSRSLRRFITTKKLILYFAFYVLGQRKKVTGDLSKEQTYISKGFKSWKKALKYFTEHEQVKHIRLLRRTRFWYQDAPMLVKCYLTIYKPKDWNNANISSK